MPEWFWLNYYFFLVCFVLVEHASCHYFNAMCLECLVAWFVLGYGEFSVQLVWVSWVRDILWPSATCVQVSLATNIWDPISPLGILDCFPSSSSVSIPLSLMLWDHFLVYLTYALQLCWLGHPSRHRTLSQPTKLTKQLLLMLYWSRK